MELLQTLFPEASRLIKQALTSSTDLSETASIIWGTLIFLLVLSVYHKNRILITSAIEHFACPNMTEKEIERYKKTFSFGDTIFHLRFLREAPKPRKSIWCFWWLNILHGLCVTLSIVLWIGSFVIHRRAWAYLNLLLVFGFEIIFIITVLSTEFREAVKNYHREQEEKKNKKKRKR